MTEAAADVTALAREALETACSGQIDRIPDFYDEAFVDHVNAMVFRGHAGARESVGFYRSLFDDLRIDVDEQVTQGNRVATRWTLHGTYRGRHVVLEGLVMSRFESGKIVEDHSVTDSLALPRALGALRTLLLLVDIARGRVKLPRGAVRAPR